MKIYSSLGYKLSEVMIERESRLIFRREKQEERANINRNRFLRNFYAHLGLIRELLDDENFSQGKLSYLSDKEFKSLCGLTLGEIMERVLDEESKAL
jgi:hypothetical protein